MNRRYFALIFGLTISLSSAQACLNDRDSDALAIQAGRLPEAINVIGGRFARNPPRFYQMRIERVKQELAAKPQNWDLYDDIAVANERLGQSQTALQWMAKKRSLLPAFDAKQPEIKEAWYRYYANDGTFRAHQWLRAGAKVQTIAQMRQARAEIARAVEIKPNAHFNREKYQLMVMDWILSIRRDKVSLGDYLEKNLNIDSDEVIDGYAKSPHIIQMKKRQQAAAQGLMGLVVLGSAWESPDVFEGLATMLNSNEAAGLRALTLLRAEEILKNHHPLSTQTSSSIETGAGRYDMDLRIRNADTVRNLFPQLRSNAELWQQSRDVYMATRFARGEHPDTTPDFWKGWVEPQPVSLDVPWDDGGRAARERVNRNVTLFFTVLSLTLATGLISLLAFLVVKPLINLRRQP